MKSSTNYSHLNKNVREIIHSSESDRIRYVLSSRWIGYSKAQEILNKLEDLLVYPKSSRMPNMLIVGDTNNGKTTLVERFVKKHPAYEMADNEGVIIPALLVQCPPVPSEARLYSNILERMFAPFKFSDPVEKKQYQVHTLLKKCNVRMLILDELHSVLAGNMEKQRIFLSVLRNLGNEVKIPIVGVGTKDALRAIKSDPQLDNRFKPSIIPRWEYNIEFRRLLKSFEMMLPLKVASDLHQKNISLKLLAMSEGYIGELAEILSIATIEAIKNGQEHISLKLLMSLDWYSPTERKKQG